MKYTKRILSLLLSLTLVLGLLPAGVLAADKAPTISIEMSIFNAGAFAKDKNNQPMMLKTVKVADLNGDGLYSLDEALVAAHTEYALKGEKDYATSVGNYGLFVTKLWGDESGAFGFYKNNTLTAGVADEVLDNGDQITAFIYYDKPDCDKPGYSDRYSFFDVAEKTVKVNDEFQLKLTGTGYNSDYITVTEPVIGASIGAVNQETGAFEKQNAFRGEHLFGDYYANAFTDKNGVKFSITVPGTYYVTAPATGSYSASDGNGGMYSYAIVPPLCKVTVLSAEHYAIYESAQKYVDEAKAQLTWNTIKGSNDYSYNVTSNPSLPNKITVDGKDVAVAWTTDDTTGAFSISSYGPYVNRPAKDDAACNLIATLTYGNATATKVFPIVIKAEGVNDKKESVVNYGDLMSGIAAGYSTSANPWVVLEMAGYGNKGVKSNSGYADGSSAVASYLADVAIQTDNNSVPDDLKTFNVDGQYAINTIPYILLAFDAANVTEDESFTCTRDAIKVKLVSYLNNLNSYSGVDDVAPVLAALAPYYKKDNTEIDAAVDKGIAWLSAQQNDDGTFSFYGTSNANSTALAVVSLAALGIDAHTDSRFVKNYKSAIEGLLTFALADHSGFGYKGNVTFNALSTEQGFRALVAYARYKESDAYNIYLQAKDSQNTVPAPNISATVVPTTPSKPEKQIQVSATVDALGETWATGSYTVKANTTVGSVLKKLFADNGITCVGLDGAYISSVTKNGVTLKEKDKGANSGWMYRVNGKMPSVGVNDYELSDGDTISFFYTTDYTKEDSAQQDTPTTTTPEFSDVSAGSYYAEAVEWAVKKGITVGTSDTTFSPDDNCTREQMAMFLWKAAGSPEPKQTGNGFTDLPGGSTAKAMLWVAEQNITSGTSDTTFSPETTCTRAQMAAFLYRYAGSPAVSGTCAFADVSAEAYYHDAVLWCVHQSITAGTGGEKFSPDAPCTRGQMVTFLYRFLGNHS